MTDKGKLRVLWIEDRAEEYTVRLDQLGERPGRAFSIDVLSRLDTILSLRTGFDGQVPDFDVVLCDFNLVEGQMLPSDTDAAGLRSRAAGFVIGTLLALRDPHRPRGVVPYSKNQEEFGDTYRLFRSYLPASIAVSEAYETDKEALEKTKVLIRAADTYRASLERLSRAGEAHFSDETVRWLLTAREEPERVSPEQVLEISYVGGSRRILLKSLFYQEYLDDLRAEAGHPALHAALTAFANGLTFVNDDFRQARQLADDYWSVSNSEDSRDSYRAVRPEQHDLPGASRARWLMTETQRSDRARAYAAIDLLIRSYVQAVLVRSAVDGMARQRDDEEDLGSFGFAESIVPTLEFVGASPTSFFAVCLNDLAEYAARHSLQSLDDMLDCFERLDRKANNTDALPTWEQRWVRALDPMPKPGQGLHHTGPAGIGRTLGRYLTDRVGAAPNDGIGPALTSSTKAVALAPELMAVARLFALELIPPGLPWPPFLQRT